jgi:hypothetical protein
MTAFSQPVMERLATGGKLRIGYRESSVPFSFVNKDTGKPVGYALELCLQIADVVKKKAGVKDLPVELVMVTSANRIDMVPKENLHEQWNVSEHFNPCISQRHHNRSPLQCSQRPHKCTND